jgi:hypothetical protein
LISGPRTAADLHNHIRFEINACRQTIHLYLQLVRNIEISLDLKKCKINIAITAEISDIQQQNDVLTTLMLMIQ